MVREWESLSRDLWPNPLVVRNKKHRTVSICAAYDCPGDQPREEWLAYYKVDSAQGTTEYYQWEPDQTREGRYSLCIGPPVFTLPFGSP